MGAAQVIICNRSTVGPQHSAWRMRHNSGPVLGVPGWHWGFVFRHGTCRGHRTTHNSAVGGGVWHPCNTPPPPPFHKQQQRHQNLLKRHQVLLEPELFTHNPVTCMSRHIHVPPKQKMFSFSFLFFVFLFLFFCFV